MTKQLAVARRVDPIIKLVLDSVTSPESKRSYAAALNDFQRRASGLTKAAVNAYKARLIKQGLAPSTINIRLSAIRRLAVEAADNGLITSDHAAAVGRVKNVKRDGVRVGNWLTVTQAESLLSAPDFATLKGKRDRALLALLIGCGLRRSEVAALDSKSVRQRDGRWVIVDLIGKGGRVRTVPMPAWAKAAIDEWMSAADIKTGRVFRPVNRGGRVTADVMTSQAVFNTVKKYAAAEIAPHDLRRTFAKLAHNGRSPLEQIQLSLGHGSIQTTERYLGVRQDLADAPCDHLGLTLRKPA